MSRILQALKQLEARPGEAAVPPSPTATLPAAATPPVTETPAPTLMQPAKGLVPLAEPTGSFLSTIPVEPPTSEERAPRGRSVTERIAPRRKLRKARRAERSAEPAPEAAAIATAEEIERLLASLGPGVIECWTPRPEVEEVILPSQAELASTPAAAQLIVHDYVPTIIEVEVPAAAAPVVEPTLTVLESLPAESEIELDLETPAADLVEEAPPPAAVATPAPVVEIAPLAEVEPAPAATSEPPAGPNEVELSFQPTKPRRTRVKKDARRKAKLAPALAETREKQVRQVVRGPRPGSVTRPSAWETTIQADLDDAVSAVRLEQLLERWQRDRGTNVSGSLLVASLAAPLAACEVAMRTAALLARREDGAVLVIDGDPDGMLSRRLGIIGNPGLSELLAPQDAHGETIYPTATPRLHVLPRGRAVWPATGDAAALQRLFAELSQEYPWLIVVAGEAPAHPVAVLARACQSTYAVAPLGETELGEAEVRLASLHAAGARVLGAIVCE